MSIKVSTRVVEGVVVVDIIGHLTLGEATGTLRESVRSLMGEGYRKILLNLSGVLHMDSCGIGELVSTYTAVRNQDGELKLFNLGKNLRNLLQVTRLYTIFETFDDQAAAIKSFQKAA
jgi:anti-sigma B factor antagonist